ncbi:hypothetical protein ACOME3_001725 [Neoechinorhynchus agilis]
MSNLYNQTPPIRPNPPPATTNEQIQRILEENNCMIQTIVDLQDKGRHQESMEYLRTLHRNLAYLIQTCGVQMQGPLPDPDTPSVLYSNEQAPSQSMYYSQQSLDYGGGEEPPPNVIAPFDSMQPPPSQQQQQQMSYNQQPPLVRIEQSIAANLEDASRKEKNDQKTNDPNEQQMERVDYGEDDEDEEEEEEGGEDDGSEFEEGSCGDDDS